MWFTTACRKRQIDDEHAKSGAKKGDADEVRGDEYPGAHKPTHGGRNHHRPGITGTKYRTGNRRPKDEAGNGKHQTEHAVTEETGHGSAEKQHDRCRQLVGGGEHR